MFQYTVYVTVYTLGYSIHSMLQYTVYVTVYTLGYSIHSMLQNAVYVTEYSVCYSIYSMLQCTIYVTVYSLYYNVQFILLWTVYVTVYNLCYSTIYVTVYSLCYSVQSTLQYTDSVTIHSLCYSIQYTWWLHSLARSRFLWSFPTEIFMYVTFLISVSCPAVCCFLIIEVKWSRQRIEIMKLLVMYFSPVPTNPIASECIRHQCLFLLCVHPSDWESNLIPFQHTGIRQSFLYYKSDMLQ